MITAHLAKTKRKVHANSRGTQFHYSLATDLQLQNETLALQYIPASTSLGLRPKSCSLVLRTTKKILGEHVCRAGLVGVVAGSLYILHVANLHGTVRLYSTEA